MFHRRQLTLFCSTCLLALLVGCATTAGGSPNRPAPVLHLVLFQLQDPADAQALAADCERLLTGIPGVVSYSCGRHVDIGRQSVVADYDLALLVGFADLAAYRGYVEHPDHLALVADWGPRFRQVVVRDFADGTP